MACSSRFGIATNIDHVQITVDEKLGVGRRQFLMTPPARCATWCRTICFNCCRWSRLEPPTRFDGPFGAHREGPTCWQRSSSRARPELDNSVRGQYLGRHRRRPTIEDYCRPRTSRPQHTKLCRAEADHRPDWRWAGVPFYCGRGKALGIKRSTRMSGRFPCRGNDRSGKIWFSATISSSSAFTPCRFQVGAERLSTTSRRHARSFLQHAVRPSCRAIARRGRAALPDRTGDCRRCLGASSLSSRSRMRSNDAASFGSATMLDAFQQSLDDASSRARREPQALQQAVAHFSRSYISCAGDADHAEPSGSSVGRRL